MSFSKTREPSFGRAFLFSKALAMVSETVAEISIRLSALSYRLDERLRSRRAVGSSRGSSSD